jgi:tetratricopeptide (TPR) repeat protein
MIASEELRALIEEWRAPVRKAGMFTKKSKHAAERVRSARRLAELSLDASGVELVEALGRASGEFAEDRDVRRAYSRALANAGRVGEAIAEFEERLQKDPDDCEDLTDVATLYERAGRADQAVDRLRRAIDLYVAANDLDAAVGAARKLIVLEPQSLESATDLVSILRARDPALLAEGVEHLADLYRERGKLGQESAACGELLTLQPDRADVKNRLASIYTRILEVDPDDQDAWVGLAAIDEPLADQLRVLLLREDDGPPAVSSNADARVEQHAAYASRKAQELMDAGDMLGASLCLERTVRIDQDPQNHLRLARCYAALHRDEAAAYQGLRALAIAQCGNEPTVADEALDWLASLLPAALEPLADAVILNHRPESADILYEQLAALWDATANAAHSVGSRPV